MIVETRGASPYLSIIIPAYNEEKRIRGTLDAIVDYLKQQHFSWELLIVLDGPQDNTYGVVQTFMESQPQYRAQIVCINRQENRGKGYTVRQGMLHASGQICLFMDADNSTDIVHFDKMQPLFEEGADLVICSRDEKDVASAQQAVPQPRFKRLLGDMGNLFIQVMAVPGIWDTQCGFKAFSQEAAKAIFTVAHVDRWAFDIEALALARNFGYSIEIVPAYWVNDERTNVRLFNYFETLFDTVKIWWNLTTGTYSRASAVVADVDTA